MIPRRESSLALRTMDLVVAVPPEPEAPPVEISDDEALCTGEEPEMPALPSMDLINKEGRDIERSIVVYRHLVHLYRLSNAIYTVYTSYF